MLLYSVTKVEIMKLFHKKTTLLLLLFLVVPALFAVSMAMNTTFSLSDGKQDVVVVEKALTGMEFVVNMLSQGQYILELAVIILAAFSFSGELEKWQIKSAIIRVCGRGRILGAKYIALMLLTGVAFIIFILWSLLLYLLLVSRTEYANGLILDSLWRMQLQSLLFVFLTNAVTVGFAFLLGLKLKTFPCFAVSYTALFATRYTGFMDGIKMLFPVNMPDYILEDAGIAFNGLPYAVLYLGYCLLFIMAAILIFRRIDIKQ